jgi:hypothetical protein
MHSSRPVAQLEWLTPKDNPLDRYCEEPPCDQRPVVKVTKDGVRLRSLCEKHGRDFSETALVLFPAGEPEPWE